MRHLASTFGALALAFTAAVPIHADPPARVARVSYIEGSVSLRPSSADDWVQASINYPMTSGDNIWTDQSSRAELHVGSTALQLGPQTALGLTALDDSHFQVRIDQGEVEVRVRASDADAAVEFDTPNGTVTLAQAGQYRVDVTADGRTSIVTVRDGQADVATATQSFALQAGQSASIDGTDNATYDVAAAPAYDDLDTWSQARDAREDAAVSRQYVSSEMTGYEDLDSYGTWHATPLYGEVWIPAGVRPGWAPYRYGHWAFVQPWGWTWIDDAPWGFAPFHYGRWAYYSGQWVWVPGAVVARPVYAPALVAFVGGPRFSVSLRFGGDGGVAWFPLAPGEAYVPTYRVSDRYVRNVNITNVHVTNINVRNINVTNIQYANERVRGGVTAVPRRSFENSQAIGRVATIVSPRDALTGTVVGHTALVAPTPASRLGRAPEEAHLTVRPPAQVFARRVVTRTAAPRTVTRAPVTTVRTEPARIPVTVAHPATPANESHSLRAAPVIMQATGRRADPVVARPVQTHPMIRTQQAVHAEPVVRAEPAVHVALAVRAEPVRAEPTMRAEPVARPAPRMEPAPVLRSQPAVVRPGITEAPPQRRNEVNARIRAEPSPAARPVTPTPVERAAHEAQPRERVSTPKVDHSKDTRRQVNHP